MAPPFGSHARANLSASVSRLRLSISDLLLLSNESSVTHHTSTLPPQNLSRGLLPKLQISRLQAHTYAIPPRGTSPMSDAALDSPSVPMPATLTPDERRQIGRERGHATVQAAMSMYRQAQTDEGKFAQIQAQVRAMAISAMPRIMSNMIALATASGKHQRAPGAAQMGAAKLVAGMAGIATEAIPGAAGGMPLCELPLDQLEVVLRTALDATQKLRAIPGQSEVVPTQSEAIDSTVNAVPIQGTTQE